MKNLIVFVIFAIVGWQAYEWFQARQVVHADGQRDSPVTESPPASRYPAETPSSSNFRCDGRTHCSQMTSCEEATFFLRNCPGVKMDGNNDGIPCEKQWCK